ncbi:MAG: exodeoxyribonuclease VII small subunit [Candidatus Sericytochromatia bacterium]
MPKRKSDTLSFEDALAELESLIARMESDGLPLSESLDAYAQSQQLIRVCQDHLQRAEAQVQVLTRLDGEDGPAWQLSQLDTPD